MHRLLPKYDVEGYETIYSKNTISARSIYPLKEDISVLLSLQCLYRENIVITMIPCMSHEREGTSQLFVSLTLPLHREHSKRNS